MDVYKWWTLKCNDTLGLKICLCGRNKRHLSLSRCPWPALMPLGSSLLKGRDSDGFPQYQEKFIRDCIRKFPYCEATLLQQLVRSIAPVEIVSEEDIRDIRYIMKRRKNIDGSGCYRSLTESYIFIFLTDCCWYNLNTPLHLVSRATTQQRSQCWPRLWRVRWRLWMPTTVLHVETREQTRGVPFVKQ